MKKLFKIFLTTIVIANISFADFNGVDIVRNTDAKVVEGVKERFGYLVPSQGEIKKNAARFNNLKFEKPDLDTQIRYAMQAYKGDSTFTKKEFEKVAKNVLKARQIASETQPSEVILVLFSMSMPKEYLKNILTEVGILQDHGYRIYSKQYLVGFPYDMDKFKSYLLGFQEYISDLPQDDVRDYVTRNFGLKVDPRLFSMFKAKKVPVVIHGYCLGRKPSKELCKFDYVMRGDASLTEMFDTISDKDPKFKPYYEALIGNKILDKNEENQ